MCHFGVCVCHIDGVCVSCWRVCAMLPLSCATLVCVCYVGVCVCVMLVCVCVMLLCVCGVGVSVVLVYLAYWRVYHGGVCVACVCGILA